MRSHLWFAAVAVWLAVLGSSRAGAEPEAWDAPVPADSLSAGAADTQAEETARPVHKLEPRESGWAGPRFGYPEFMRTPFLDRDFSGVMKDYWASAGASRAFEAKQRSLEDFSNIDIPIKFPATIGRVIGQGANLNVTGSEQITFGGQTRYRVDEPLTEYGRSSKFPQLNMKQHLKIDLKGTVGEKINVLVHHDSDIETPLENRIKLRYEGDDDEIVQSVEMGNTNLSIPGSQFVGYSEQHQGLFGAKVLAKLGDLDVTAVASKQEGRTSGASFQGAAARDSVRKADLDFVRNKYFFMILPEDVIRARQEALEKELPLPEVTDVEVYLDDGNGNNDEGGGVVEAYAFVDPDSSALPPEAQWDSLAYKGDFNLLERNKDYAIDPQTGELSLLKPLDAAHYLAVTYVFGPYSVGGIDSTGSEKRLFLKMIRPSEKYMIEREAVWGGTLKYERKNVYSLGTNYISEEKVVVRIYRENPGGDVEYTQLSDDGIRYDYAKILGIDLEDENNTAGTAANSWATDGYADGGTINGELGLLLFPDLRPFDPQVASPGARPDYLKDPNARIYDVHPRYLDSDEDSKYYMWIFFSTPQTTFKLPNANILENSESVTLNGRRLTRNVDYEIYYDVGQIRFKIDEAASPDAKITVDYQYVPYLATAQQSLFGIQGTYKLSDMSYVSSAWIYQSKQSPEERPRLGQEPSRIVLGDINTRLEFEPRWLTDMVDALPVVAAESPSRLSLSAEVAASLPDPNTKGSVYIEDMEGVRDLRSFSLSREAWEPASPPPDVRWQDSRRVWWYVKDREIREKDLFPEAESRPGEAFIPVLEMDLKGPKYDWAGADPIPANQWAGLERLVSKNGSDYSDLRFMELWLRQKSGSGGTMMVDLGAVSENFYRPWNDSLHTEDKDHDGKLSDEENVGLDGVASGAPGDDGGADEDAYSFTEAQRERGDYSGINGTERNPSTIPDTEDLDSSGDLDQDEIFLRLKFDLADTTYIVSQSGDWKHYRVPLADADTVGGSPSWKSIRYIRFLVTGVDSPAVFQIAYLQISGASWLEEGIRTKADMSRVEHSESDRETFEISAKNTRDDLDYAPPYDPGTDAEGYRKREQSLVFGMRNLEAGHSGSVYKTLAGSSGDYTLYHTLSFYVHGDQRAASESLYLFVRLGSDSINFYECGTKVQPGWQDVKIKFDEITNLKSAEADSTVIYGKRVALRGDTTATGWAAVYGDPSITRVSRIGAGVVNNGSVRTSDEAIEVWFDDMRLTDVRRESGYAKRVSVGASLSDVLTLSADYKQSDTEFQNLGSTRKGTDDTDVSLSASTGIDKFLPDMGVSLPFAVGYHESRSVPTLSSRSDVALREDQRREEERTSVDDNYSLGFSRRSKSGNPLLRLTLDGLSGRASYTRKRGNSPEMEDNSNGYSGSLSYVFKPWWTHSFRIYRGYGISYLPETVNLSMAGSTRNTWQFDKRQDFLKQDRYTREVKGDFSISFKPISGPALETDYMLSANRDLDQNKQVPILSSIGKGTELKRSQRASLTLRPALTKVIKPALGYNVNYDENADPSVRSSGDPSGVRRASVSSRSTLDLLIQPSVLVSAPEDGNDSLGVSLLRRLLAAVPDVDVGYFLDRSSKYNKLRRRPGLRYQLGIDPSVDPRMIYSSSTAAGQPTDDITRSDGVDVSTDFNPVETVSLTTKYRLDKTERTYAGLTTVTKETVWPDVTSNISSDVYLSLFRGKIKSSSIVTGYKGTKSTRGQSDEDTGRTRRSEWTPLVGWDATWANGVRTTLNIRRSSNTTEDTKGTGSEKNSKTTSANFSVRHSFSAPEGMYIPFAGRTVKLKSSLSVQLDLAYESRIDTTPSANDRVDASRRVFSIAPKASYSFSKNVTGSADAKFEQSTDRKLKQTYRTIALNASVLIHF
jgi:hypothetical protein